MNLLLNETLNNSDLVIVDIQPEYEDGFNFNIEVFTEFINNNYNKYNSVTFLYNGESLGMISENEYVGYLIENGLEEEVINYVKFYDKGYGSFRVCIDEGYEKDLVDVVKYMYKNDIIDSRELEDIYMMI